MIFFPSLHRKLDAILARIGSVEKDQQQVTQELQALTQQVHANTDAEQSAIQLLNGLSQQLKDAAEDPVAVRALADQLKTSGDALAAAVLANTPAQPTPPNP